VPKKRSYLFIAFFPYIISLLYSLFTGILDQLMNLLSNSNNTISAIISHYDEFLYAFGYLLISVITPTIYIIALITSIKILINSKKNNWNAHALLRSNMIIKLCHIPYYVVVFYVGMALFLFAGPILAFIYDCLVMLTSGIVGLAALLRARKEEKINTSLMLIFAVTQFLFCIDVPIAIVMYFIYRNKPVNNKHALNETT
jgi:hypothetical protein